VLHVVGDEIATVVGLPTEHRLILRCHPHNDRERIG
jgi:hypothetical protein